LEFNVPFQHKYGYIRETFLVPAHLGCPGKRLLNGLSNGAAVVLRNKLILYHFLCVFPTCFTH